MKKIYRLQFSLFGPSGDISRNEKYFESREDALRQQENYERNCRYPHSCHIEEISVKEGAGLKQSFADGWFAAMWTTFELLVKENCHRQIKRILDENGVGYDELESHRPESVSEDLKKVLENYYKKFIPR